MCVGFVLTIFFSFAEIYIPPRSELGDLNLDHFNYILQLEVVGTGHPKYYHPRAFHILLRTPCRQSKLSDRKRADNWVGTESSPTPAELLVPFARHGITNPQTDNFENKIRDRILRSDPRGDRYKDLLVEVDTARAEYQTYLESVSYRERSEADWVEAENERIVGDCSDLTVSEVLTRWGFIVDPSEDIPLKRGKKKKEMAQQGARGGTSRRPKVLTVAERQRKRLRDAEEAEAEARRLAGDSSREAISQGTPNLEDSSALVVATSVREENPIHEEVREDNLQLVLSPAQVDRPEQTIPMGIPIPPAKRPRTQVEGTSTAADSSSPQGHSVADPGVSVRMAEVAILPADLASFKGAPADLWGAFTSHLISVRRYHLCLL